MFGDIKVRIVHGVLQYLNELMFYQVVPSVCLLIYFTELTFNKRMYLSDSNTVFNSILFKQGISVNAEN